ncbi:YppF family protein [Ornithinibacillus halophilus]|uniref:YppF-like protein n=1 Tax=Ornithinibacillus halophilus TaxID=930117 RepID=A0A1M5I2P8_9BACI|nr:YppF family protein [Ornithinibacillus halophilus]SHG22511.1 YppF-like protein [Ornithinibacillus halophilus]
MLIQKLVTEYQRERNQEPNTLNDLLDYYQKKYITGEIDVKDYREIYDFLHQQGATSAHEYV